MSPGRQVYWRKQAINDLATISAYIAAHSPASAARLIDAIIAQVELLTTYPQMGRIGRRAGMRELVVHTHYLVIYRVLPDAINIQRVKHVARKGLP